MVNTVKYKLSKNHYDNDSNIRLIQIEPYSPKGVYGEIIPLLGGNILKELRFHFLSIGMTQSICIRRRQGMYGQLKLFAKGSSSG